jgi:hypothetical protein
MNAHTLWVQSAPTFCCLTICCGKSTPSSVPAGRSAFLVETARSQVRRQKLLQFLESKDSAWKEKDHPDLAEGASAWVRRLRAESDARGNRPRSHAKRNRHP